MLGYSQLPHGLLVLLFTALFGLVLLSSLFTMTKTIVVLNQA